MKTSVFLIIFSIILLSSCNLSPKKINFNNDELKPLWKAMTEVNRDSLGFTQIDKNADISIENESILFEKPYDKMIHIYGKTSRTIAFKKITSEKYVWIGEQEIYTDPRKFETADGEQNEQITITYDKLPISGAPINVIYISYFGPDEKLSQNPELKIIDIKPFTEKWIK
jgi:hypothetical protein